MASRARELLDRSRVLLDRSRVAAAQFLTAPPKHPGYAPPAGPAFVELTRPEPVAAPSGEGVLAEICASVALRDLNLLDQLLARLEELEAGEEDHHRLAELYQLDHLATRLRRNAENLRVLAGQDAGGAADETSSLVDVIRAALSSIEQYTRVEIGRVAALAVVGFAADDIGRLLAELLDNATAQSPPTTTVTVSAHLTERGSVLLRLEDAGIGLPEERQRELNEWLASTPVLDGSAIEHMGLAVVRRLAQKHGVRVSLGRRAPHGTTATVLLPPELVREAAPTTFTRRPPAAPAEPAAAAEPVAATVSGLPRRTRSTGATRTEERPVVRETTPSGLPRRQPRSLRDGTRPPDEPTAAGGPPDSGTSAGGTSAVSTSHGDTSHGGGTSAGTPGDVGSGGRQFVADLAAFAEGEQQARTGQLANPADPVRDDPKGGPDDE